jgi:hypothetical protein
MANVSQSDSHKPLLYASTCVQLRTASPLYARSWEHLARDKFQQKYVQGIFITIYQRGRFHSLCAWDSWVQDHLLLRRDKSITKHLYLLVGKKFYRISKSSNKCYYLLRCASREDKLGRTWTRVPDKIYCAKYFVQKRPLWSVVMKVIMKFILKK